MSMSAGTPLQIHNSTVVPDNAEIVLYADYSRQLARSTYITNVSGCVLVPGKRTLGNRAKLFAVRQLLKGARHRLPRSPDNDRNLSWITAKILPGVSLKVNVRPETHIHGVNSARLHTVTDEYGTFSVALRTNYVPHQVVVTCRQNHKIAQSARVSVIGLSGVSVISDIDDTVRYTGVPEGLLPSTRNVLWRPYNQCTLPGVAQWYREMHDLLDCPVHYISNGPWQFYNAVYGFLQYAKLPVQSLDLRKCLGRLRVIINGLTVEAEKRKHDRINEIVRNFTGRGFVLMGDSGESDLEAYAHIAFTYSDQILAVYIRAVPGTFTSKRGKKGRVRDRENVRILQEILDARTELSSGNSTPSPPDVHSNNRVSDASSSLFDHPNISDLTPSTPIISEASVAVPKILVSPASHPALAPEAKLRDWIRRVNNVALLVPACIPVRFWWDVDDVKEESFRKIREFEAQEL